jgi:hypothetical protein
MGDQGPYEEPSTVSPPLPLPEGFTLETVLTIGNVSMTVQGFIRYGMVIQDGPRFFQISPRPTLLRDSVPGKPNPFSLRELERRGYKVLPGITAADDLVQINPGSYCRISQAARNGLLNH